MIEARASNGLLQAEVAAKLNKPQSFVSKYERGERRLDFSEFVEVAAALGLDVPEFIGDYIRRTGGSSKK